MLVDFSESTQLRLQVVDNDNPQVVGPIQEYSVAGDKISNNKRFSKHIGQYIKLCCLDDLIAIVQRSSFQHLLKFDFAGSHG